MASDKHPALKYLALPADYTPSPTTHPIEFLEQNLAILPPHILVFFTENTSPKQRASIVRIRNRRMQYTNRNPEELRFERARNTWPEMWEGRERRGKEEGAEEKKWVQEDFLGGRKQHVGKLADLLGDYEEEREAQRVREERARRVDDEFVPEEEEDSDEDEDVSGGEEEGVEEAKRWFERMIREKFIYGLLGAGAEYDRADWDEELDNERDAEERWFAED